MPATTEMRAEERLAALFPQEVANDYRSRWDVVQRGFVDDPRQAVRQGDELVAQVLKNLSESFSNERATLEGQLGKADQASTETCGWLCAATARSLSACWRSKPPIGCKPLSRSARGGDHDRR